MSPTLYLSLLILELLFLMGATGYIISIIYSSIRGAVYVPTTKKVTKEILQDAHLKKGQIFLELGSGDGRVVRLAVKEYGVKGIGVEINPTLIWWSKFKDLIQHIKGIRYLKEDVLKTKFSDADIIYIFLMPELVEKMKKRLETETKKKALIISHGFKIKGWETYLIKMVPRKSFNTFYYKL